MREQDYEAMYLQEQGHWWYAGMRAILLSLLPPDGSRVRVRALDAGCGTGFQMSWMKSNYGCRVMGLDYAPYALPYCRRRSLADLVRGSVVDLPFADRSFGLVTCLDVLTHLEGQPRRSRALQEIFRVLEPGGTALIRVAANEWLRSSHDAELQTLHRFSREELNLGMRLAGFELLRFTFANTILFPLAILWRLLKRIGLVPGGSDVAPTTRGPEWMNAALRAILSLEGAILKSGSRSLPFGLSIVVVARRPSECYTADRS